jgi:hypothetical protein
MKNQFVIIYHYKSFFFKTTMAVNIVLITGVSETLELETLCTSSKSGYLIG